MIQEESLIKPCNLWRSGPGWGRHSSRRELGAGKKIKICTQVYPKFIPCVHTQMQQHLNWNAYALCLSGCMSVRLHIKFFSMVIRCTQMVVMGLYCPLVVVFGSCLFFYLRKSSELFQFQRSAMCTCLQVVHPFLSIQDLCG